ncbi:hypothetical protein ACKW6Q_18735 [Chryseobacterium kwangjuense]|uniref:Uncharacterized protein n=1 Tax=Chryseobacterium kwangjuense TaxID=267125 RepID=A0ABW9K930_9FLAO
MFVKKFKQTLSLLFIFIASCTSMFFSQQLVSKSTFDTIEYVEDVDWDGSDIYCAGFSFKTIINDGNACDAYLVHYDTQLKPQWTLKISDEHTNKIFAVKRHKDKIYALVVQGKATGSSEDVFMKLFTINLNGVIENKVTFGRTFNSPSNIVINGPNLIFGYRIANGTSYSADFKNEIISYNIDTRKFARHTSTQYLATPKKIVADQSNIFLFGNYIHPNQPNIMAYKNGKYSEISVNAPRTEYFLDSYIQKNVLTLVCSFPGEYGNKKTYLKYYYINLATHAVTSTAIPYENLGWSDMNFDTYNQGTSSWMITEDDKTKDLHYILVDDKGKVTKTLAFDRRNGNGSWENYIIRENNLLNANSNGIYLYKID